MTPVIVILRGPRFALGSFDNQKTFPGGKNMNKLNGLIIAVSLMAGLSASALSGKNPPRNDGSGNVQCAWYDAGSTEEHGPHLTLDECNRAGHPRCDQRCYVYDSVCRVDGIRIEIASDKDGKPVRRDVVTSFSGRHHDEFRAREIADRECLLAFPRQDSCRQSGWH